MTTIRMGGSRVQMRIYEGYDLIQSMDGFWKIGVGGVIQFRRVNAGSA